MMARIAGDAWMVLVCGQRLLDLNGNYLFSFCLDCCVTSNSSDHVENRLKGKQLIILFSNCIRDAGAHFGVGGSRRGVNS